MNEKKLKSAAEAILFACGTPVETERIAQTLAIGTDKAEELCMQLKEEYADPIRTIMDIRRNTPLSQAASEVLAVIAYNQPVTKAFVEQIRGVDCSGVVASLISRQLIEEKGRLELPGRPLVYGTTEHFLRCFNISSLDELPPLPVDDEDSDDASANESDGGEEN